MFNGSAQFVATLLGSSTPLILAALGGTFAYRSGIYHLGLEGLMLIAAFVSVAVAAETGSILLALLLAIAASLVASFIFWIVLGPLKANQFIAGLGLTLVGIGGTAFALNALFDARGSLNSDIGLPQPVSGVNSGALAAVSELSILVWLTPVLVWASWFVLRRTRYGLRLTMVGEYPFAATAAGSDIWKMRLGALLVAGFLAALAGVELALGGLTIFSENMANGRGFIAFVAVLFGAGHPVGAAAAALFFGFVDAVGIQSQLHLGGFLPEEAILALPYVLTIIAVVVSGHLRRESQAAASGTAELRDL